MPDQALPILLARLESTDIARRRKALGMLRHSPMTSQIDSAMQIIATDTGSELAPAAKFF